MAPSSTPGLHLSVTTRPRARTRTPIAVHGIAAFPHTEAVPTQWIRSIFLTVTSECSGMVYHKALFRDAIVFADDVKTQTLKTGDIATLMAFGFDLTEKLRLKLVPDRYYLQLSAAQFQSAVEVAEVH